MIYPTSVSNPMEWYMSTPSDPRCQLSGSLDSATVAGDVWTFEGNDAARFNIFTTDGYNASLINLNHPQIAARGYMMSPKDWKNLEMTCYFKLTASADDQMVMYARGGKHGDRPCEGFAYKADLYFSGQVRVAKEQWHVSYEFSDTKDFTGSVEGRWVGMKSIFYNQKVSDTLTQVVMELYVDVNADNNWQLAMKFIDKGGFGSEGGECGGAPDQIGTWGGPVAAYRWDSVDTFQMKWASVREINVGGEFNEGGSAPDVGHGSGGTGDTGVGGGVACYCPPPTPVIVDPNDNVPQTPVDTGGGNTANGACLQTLYETTGRTEKLTEEPFKTRHYASGKPDDITKEVNSALGCPFDSYELTLYVTVDDTDHDDNISVKCYGPQHDDGIGKWYITDLSFDAGLWSQTHEEPHPTTPKPNTFGTRIGSIVGKEIGMKVVIWKKGSGAHMEGWADYGDRIWKKGISTDNIDGKLYSPDDDQKIQIRIDAAHIVKYKCFSVQEIKPGIYKGTGPGTTPTPTPTPTVPQPTGGTCTCGGNPTSSRGAPSGASGSTEPPSVITISRDFTFLLNVGVDTEDNCTTGNPLEVHDYKSIYDPPVENNVYRDLGYLILYTNGASEAGHYINNTNSLLYDQIIRKVVVKAIKRTVDALSESCTGTLRCRIINYHSGQVRLTFDESVNVASIDVNDQQLTFTKDDNKYKCVVGDMVVLQYYSDDALPDKCLKFKHNSKDILDSVNTYMITKTYSGYTSSPENEAGLVIYI